MPVAEGTTTLYIIQNMQDSVNNYNLLYSMYVHDYKCFIRERDRLLTVHNGSFARLLNDPRFANGLHDILTKFGMNARASELAPRQRFLDAIGQVSSEFELLSTAQIRLFALDLHQMIGSRTVYSIVGDIFNHFVTLGQLSMAGGFVVASKTMHFILPELFVMLDGQHVGVSLYNIADYHPHRNDGRDWFEVIPNYSGRKPNPSPRGAGRKSWDSERYSIALMYYNRIIREWCQRNNSNIENFLDLDSRASTPARIIDKALW